MKLITAEIRAQLLANCDNDDADHKPVVKLFTPDAGATWLLSELCADGDTAFGLCDLGLGFPELGYVSLSELETIRGPFGLPVERDMYWTATKTLSEYAEEASAAGGLHV